VPHHLIDVRYAWESYDAATFARDALAAVAAIEARERVALVVGGSALYLKALLEGLLDGPAADPEIRSRLKAVAAAGGPEILHARLAEVDPLSAARLHPNDQVRIVRALEVFEQTGRPISSQQTQFGRRRPGLNARVICLRRGRADLDERIDGRVEEMFARGLVAETRSLALHPAGLGPQAGVALGYKQILDHLRGTTTRRECVASVKRATRRFARKQMTWFRCFAGVSTVLIAPHEPVESACRRALGVAFANCRRPAKKSLTS